MEERLLELLESVLGSYKKTSGDNYAFYSPFVDHYKPKLEINIQINSKGNNPWHCWISDEKGRSIKTLFRKLRVSKSTWDEYNAIFSRVNRYSEDQTNTIVTERVELPREFKPLYKKSDSFKYKHALNYLISRGLRPEDIVKYNIGYCEEGEYRDKIIIPSYDDSGKLNFFVGRSFYQTEYKHKNPKVSKDIVGFDLLINWDTPLVLCEGAFDAISVRRNAIPLFGKAIQSELEKKIIGNSVKKLYIVLDSDAIKNAIGLAKKFMSYGIETHLVDMGDEDASEMGYDRINKKIYDTPPLDLRKLMEYQLFKV
jgi:DNA primase|tara:strand:+ start:1329 stop:2264 length:936 start_codon:yes stop_codon:yes gene_type:complete